MRVWEFKLYLTSFDYEINEDSSDARAFKRMYGKAAKMIDVMNVNQITKTMNQLFLAK